jgi:hypothetical protein
MFQKLLAATLLSKFITGYLEALNNFYNESDGIGNPLSPERVLATFANSTHFSKGYQYPQSLDKGY